MPYIKQEERFKIDIEAIDSLASTIGGVAGNANYIITMILNEAFDLSNNPSYAKLNEAIGVLECVKLELYRRIAAPYEDKKIKENGDVY